MAQLIVIGTCAVLAAISAAAIPSAGLVTMVMVMQASSSSSRQVSTYLQHCTGLFVHIQDLISISLLALAFMLAMLSPVAVTKCDAWMQQKAFKFIRTLHRLYCR